MSFAPVAYGAATSGSSNAALTPALPAGILAGNLLLMGSGIYMGATTQPDLTSQGWYLASPQVNQTTQALYMRIATGNSADNISINWGYPGTTAYAYVKAYS